MHVLVSVCGPARSAARGPSLRGKRPLFQMKSKNALLPSFSCHLSIAQSSDIPRILVVTHLEAVWTFGRDIRSLVLSGCPLSVLLYL